MALNNSEKGNDNFYSLLGLKKECTTTELRTAYKKLALVSFLSIYFYLARLISCFVIDSVNKDHAFR